MRNGVLALVFAACAASTAAAQTGPDSRFSVGVAGGLGTGHHAGAALGGAFSVRLTPRVDTEFEATYADRGPGVEALIFEGRAQVALLDVLAVEWCGELGDLLRGERRRPGCGHG